MISSDTFREFASLISCEVEVRFFSSIISRISVGPLLLVVVSALSLLIFDFRSETALRHVIDKHDELTRMKDVVQRAIVDMAAAQQSASDHLTLSDVVDETKLNQIKVSFAARVRRVCVTPWLTLVR